MKTPTNLFDLMTDWRQLPAYQLERRADIFFALYLEDLLKYCGYFAENEILTIIPEFPAKHENDNQSDKIDYMVCSERKVVYVELKTDNNSLRDEQNKYLDRMQQREWRKALNDIIEIYQETGAKKKYEHLLEKLNRWIECRETGEYALRDDEIKKVIEREVVYILPNKSDKYKHEQIHFCKIVEMLLLPKYADDSISRAFAKALITWSNNPV